MNCERLCLTTYPNAGKRLDNTTHSGVFLAHRFWGVLKSGQTWPFVFNLSFKLKLKIRGKRDNLINLKCIRQRLPRLEFPSTWCIIINEFENFCSIFWRWIWQQYWISWLLRDYFTLHKPKDVSMTANLLSV